MNQPYPSPMQHHQMYPPPPRKKRVWPWLAIPAGVLLFGGCVAAVASVDSPSNSAVTTVQRAPAPVNFSAPTAPTSTLPLPPPVPAGPASTIRRDGTYMVGADIVPGTWRSDGGSGCYWERLADLRGTLDSIIANELGQGPQLVTILASDRAFKAKRCGTWTLVPE